MTSAILLTVVTAATPLLLAALGELVAERSGVLNLGVEGMMIMGAVTAFLAASATGSPLLGVLVAGLVGVLMAGLFAALVLGLAANQVASGLALTIFGLGLAGLLGEGLVGQPGEKLGPIAPSAVGDIPLVGSVLAQLDILTVASFALTAAVALVLTRTRIGLTLRAVGDRPQAAHALGLPVLLLRLLATLFGGLCAGLAGAYLTLVYTPQWVENMTAGRGWIALALVVFASWRPLRVLAGAYLFGAVTIAQFHAQALGVDVPSQLLAALPYLATVVVLVVIARDRRATLVNTPASLGRPFVPDR